MSEFMSHNEALHLIQSAHSVSTLSYEEAISIYLRARGILRDGQKLLSAPVPEDWDPQKENKEETDGLHRR